MRLALAHRVGGCVEAEASVQALLSLLASASEDALAPQVLRGFATAHRDDAAAVTAAAAAGGASEGGKNKQGYSRNGKK